MTTAIPFKSGSQSCMTSVFAAHGQPSFGEQDILDTFNLLRRVITSIIEVIDTCRKGMNLRRSCSSRIEAKSIQHETFATHP